jgi:murein lipoprotein
MNKKLLITGVITTSVLLGGCANADLEKSVSSLSSKVNELSARVDTIKSEHQDISSSIQSVTETAADAASDAMRANTRITNIVSSYKK